MFCEAKNGEADAKNQHYRKCSMERLPYVTVRYKRKWAKIAWDCISLPSGMDDYTSNNERLARRLLDACDRFDGKLSSIGIASYVGDFEVPIESAALAARTVFDLIESELPPQKDRGQPNIEPQ